MGIAILLIFTDQPLVLLVIASALSAIVMFVDSILLIIMNRGVLPHAIRLVGFCLAVMCFAVVWFGYFPTRVVIEYGGAALVMAGSRTLRLRVLLALTVWLVLIGLVKLVEAL